MGHKKFEIEIETAQRIPSFNLNPSCTTNVLKFGQIKGYTRTLNETAPEARWRKGITAYQAKSGKK